MLACPIPPGLPQVLEEPVGTVLEDIGLCLHTSQCVATLWVPQQPVGRDSTGRCSSSTPELPPGSHLHLTHRAGTPLARSTRYSSSACVGLTRRSRAPTHSNTGVCTCSTALSGCLTPHTWHPTPILTLPYLSCLGDGRAQ